MNKEEIISELSRISTPTGLTPSGDYTLDDYTCDEILEYISEQENENTNLKYMLNRIVDYANSDELLERLLEPKINNKGETHYDLIRKDILQIIDKVGGNVMTTEELLKRKAIIENKLRKADKSNNLILCIELGKALNEIDKKIRKLGGDFSEK